MRDDLDERHDRRRVEEVQADDALRMTGPRGDAPTDSALVFVARIVVWGVDASSVRKIVRLSSRSSIAHSITRSGPRRPAHRASTPGGAVEPFVHPRVAVAVQVEASRAPFEAVPDARPAPVDGGRVHVVQDPTWRPASSATWAMPAPIVPTPTTPTGPRQTPSSTDRRVGREDPEGSVPRSRGRRGNDVHRGSGCRPHHVGAPGPRVMRRRDRARGPDIDRGHRWLRRRRRCRRTRVDMHRRRRRPGRLAGCGSRRGWPGGSQAQRARTATGGCGAVASLKTRADAACCRSAASSALMTPLVSRRITARRSPRGTRPFARRGRPPAVEEGDGRSAIR